MNNFEKLLLEAKNELFSLEVVQEYFKLSKILKEDEHLKCLDVEMKKHQKAMCQNENNDEIYLKEKSLYEKCKNEIESNPLWINFQTVKEEVYSLLVDIKNVLS